MTTSKHVQNLAFFCSILLLVFSACNSSGTGGTTDNNDSTVVNDSGTAIARGSCNNENRNSDQLPSATVIEKDMGLEMINNFGSVFYREAFNPATFSPVGTVNTFATEPNQRVGAFISKHMLDALFDRDLNANGIMVYIGRGPGADGTEQLQYIVTTAEKTHNAAPALPDGTSKVYLKVAEESWCPTNCTDLR